MTFGTWGDTDHAERVPNFLRSVEVDVLPTCRRHRTGVIVWTPRVLGPGARRR